MSADPQGLDHATLRERTDEAFAVSRSTQNPRVAPRLIAFAVAILIGVAIVVILFALPA